MDWEKQLTDNQSEVSMNENITNLTKAMTSGEKSSTTSSMQVSPKQNHAKYSSDKRYDNNS